MANVWKRVTHRTPPPSATIGRPNRDGVASAVWTDSKGNRHKRDVTKAADGGWRLLMESYSIKYRDHRGIVVTETTGLTNKELAERVLAEKLDQCEQIKSGRISASEVRTLGRSKLPMSQLVSEFLATIASEPYRDASRRYLNRFFAANPTIRAVEIDSRAVQRWIDDQAADGVGGAAMTAGRAALSSFTRWMYRTNVLSQPTVLQVTLPKTQPRRPRRAFGQEEFQRFLNAVQGDGRRLIYIFAASTGLRAKEISCVTIAHLKLDGDRPSVRLDGAWTKNKKDGIQPITPMVANMIAGWVESQGLSGDDKLFPNLPARASMSHWFLADLARAGIPHVLNGSRLNFHSLRKSFISWLLADGRDLRVVQKLARHSSPLLTAGTYCDERLLDGRSAIASLPVLTVTPLVTPTPGVTSDLLTTHDNSTGSRNGLDQANQRKTKADLYAASHNEDVCITNRVSGLFQSVPAMLSPVGDTGLDTIADGIAASLSRDELVLLVAKLAVRSATMASTTP